MAFRNFHTAVKDWFNQSFEHPTAVQEQAWEHIHSGAHTLIAAPTGSGKTLAAFLASINRLVELGLKGQLEPKNYIIYVSPLKALSNDIERNLQKPLQGIKKQLKENNLPPVDISIAVRTGDTTPAERTAMMKKPPHIIVTTPESLYLLLTSQGGRRLLQATDTIIIDEIHAMLWDKRGSHLALSVERLEHLTPKPLHRIGLSATQKPIEKVAQFLAGYDQNGKPNSCKITDKGHSRELKLAIGLPNSPLTAVMPNEVWDEIYQQIVDHIEQHNTTLIFVNTRRLAERLAHRLSDKIGEDKITAHHGSMSKEHRHSAEQKLKEGKLKALIATASMELGIDVGSIDLVIQIGSPRSIAAFLQRVGRSGHSVVGTPKGILYPLSRDELVEAAALFDAIRRGELDEIIIPDKPIDILAQQIVAEVASDDYHEKELYNIFKHAFPFQHLEYKEYQRILDMLSEGFTSRRGRRGAYIHYDKINGNLKARKGARLTALISGGSIPDNFEYDAILEPENIFIGSLNEDFAAESLPGDVFQLGNTSYRVLRVETGKIYVEDAEGQPPSIPFWFGEAPGRTIELSESVSRLRATIDELLPPIEEITHYEEDTSEKWKQKTLKWLTEEVGISDYAADQLIMYLATAKTGLGLIPTHKKLMLERFFDETGDMHLVVHAPFGSRMNRAWGFSLRKRFCKKFNFELQAAATEDAVILSLGSTHSFQLDEVYRYLNSNNVREILIQAMLDAPVFEIRWRWNASRSLAILRNRAGKKVPPQIQRMQAEDLVAQVFPDQIACFENIDGAREVPDHPLVNQTIHDCLTEAMDIEHLENLLKQIENNELELHTAELTEPSVLAQEIVNARPYAFLDETEFIERRTNAVRNRRWLDPADAKDLGKLDIEAINRVREEAWPVAESTEELHDALCLHGYITEREGKVYQWNNFFEELVLSNRATKARNENGEWLWVATERLPYFRKAFKQLECDPEIDIPERIYANMNLDNPLVEIIRGRLEALGPITNTLLTKDLGIKENQVDQALFALENEGFAFRGNYTGDAEDRDEWCERRLLARIHQYTIQRLRKEIEPVNAPTYMRFLFHWHHLSGEIPEGQLALQQTMQKLEGYEAQAAAWEGDIIPSRISNYEHFWLDSLFLTGNTIWGRFKKNESTKGPIKTTPISMVSRNNIAAWKNGEILNGNYENLSHTAKTVYETLKNKGACFFDYLLKETRLLPNQVEDAMSELVSFGVLTSDSYNGLRAFLVDSKFKSKTRNKRNSNADYFSLQNAGRWSLLDQGLEEQKDTNRIETIAWTLLQRYGIVFRKVLEREPYAPRWRDLARHYRLLEARGEIRGGRFINGFWGEQFALPETIKMLRKLRKDPDQDEFVTISASDPLNLTGIITNESKVPSIYSNRILYKNGIPVAMKEGKNIAFLHKVDEKEAWQLKNKLIQRNISPKLRPYLGKGIL